MLRAKVSPRAPAESERIARETSDVVRGDVAGEAREFLLEVRPRGIEEPPEAFGHLGVAAHVHATGADGLRCIARREPEERERRAFDHRIRRLIRCRAERDALGRRGDPDAKRRRARSAAPSSGRQVREQAARARRRPRCGGSAATRAGAGRSRRHAAQCTTPTCSATMPPARLCQRALVEARLADHRRERLLVGVHADRFREITIARRIPGDDAAEARQEVEGVGVVDGAKRSTVGFENSSTSRRPPGRSTRRIEASAAALSVTFRRPKPIVTQSKLRSAKGRHSAFAITNATCVPMPRSIRRSRPRASISRLMSVSTARPSLAHLAREAGAEVAGAGGDVERAMAGPKPGLGEREALPKPVQAARHQVVHQVVVAGDRVEYAAHARGLFRGRDFLVAEIDGFHGLPILRERPFGVRLSARGRHQTNVPVIAAGAGVRITVELAVPDP